jgi:predicted amidohydrolase YtcJ
VPARSAAQLAVLNANIRTLDPRAPWATAVAVADGVITAVGSDAWVREHCDARTELIDAGGATLCPGLVDAHIHPFNADFSRGADLTACETLDDLRGALAAERERGGGDGWVVGWGLSYKPFEERPIEGAAIEAAVAGAPALVTFMDLHTAVATRRALDDAGITGPVQFPDGASVVVADGVPTGELRESPAIDLVRAAMPPLTDAERRSAALAVQHELHRVGITGVHAMDGTPREYGLLRDLEASGDLALRAVVPLWQKPDMSMDEMREQLPLRDERGRLWRGGVAKFFIDGVVESGTAWLVEPDTLGGGTRPYWPDPGVYQDAVAMFAGAGFQCVTHAVGDRAVRAALDAYQAAGPAPACPHRIEHIETAQDVDIARFAPEGVAASCQPLHMQWHEDDESDVWTRRLGRERSDRGWRTADLRRAGVPVALGSDWPVATHDPRVGMAWTRLRRRPGDREARVWGPEQRLDPMDTLLGYTQVPALVVGEQERAGRIAEGFNADISGFAMDLLSCDADELPDLPVVLTVVDGAVAFTALPGD